MGLGASLSPLDLAVNVAFPAITSAFALETQAIRWVIAAYVLVYSSLMLAFGKLGDTIGYRRIFRAGLVVSAAAFVLCALAPDYGWLLAARLFQGLGVALLLSCAPALATSFYDEGRRTWVLGAYASMAAAAGVVAPLVGGASIALLGWAGVFWFRAPIAVLSLMLLAFLPPAAEPAHPAAQRSFDLGGVSLLAVGVALALLAPTLLQTGDSMLLAGSSALGGAILLYVFALRQRGAEQPFLPGAVVRDPGFVLLNLASAAVHFSGFAVPLLVPYYLARISGYGPMEIGGLLSLWPAGILAGSALASPAARRLGRRRAAMLGGALLAAGQFAIGQWPSPSLMLLALFVQGAGIGLFQVAYADIVIGMLPQRDRGVAGSLTILTRTIGILVAAAALTASLHALEARNLAAGMDVGSAFLGAFKSVFVYSALAFGIFFALASVRGHIKGPGSNLTP